MPSTRNRSARQAEEIAADDEYVDMRFTNELRKATQDIHKLSDVLINTKFAVALTDDTVWYDVLLAFYEVYKFFETHLPERLLPKELHRHAAFERDFEHFYGPDWRTKFEPRPSVKAYIAQLEKVAAKSELLLFAYAYQMYMAIMSGGQMLQKKRMIQRKLWIFPNGSAENQAEADAAADDVNAAATNAGNNTATGGLQARPMPAQVTICPPGCEATYFSEKIPVLKAKLRRVFNQQYSQLNDEMRAKFIEESRNVFRLNMEVVRSIRGVNRANLKRLAIVGIFVTTIYLAIKLAMK